MKPLIEHLYVHIPFCSHICPYCSFFVQKNLLSDVRDFLEALKIELAWAQQQYDFQLKTIYFGGGTPSILSVSQLEEFSLNWPFAQMEEFSFECNPFTITQEKAKLLKEIGVNRISLGIQSFDPHFLKVLGRKHTREQVRQTVEILRQSGFDNINIDLIFAIPTQTLDQWLNTLEEAVSLQPRHISAYNLTFEEDTEFFSRLQKGEWIQDEALQKEMFVSTREVLAKHGFEGYEVSNFAQKGYRSLHNLAYWKGKDYIGLGPSACSTVGEKRWQNLLDTKKYVRKLKDTGAPPQTMENLTPQIKMVERIFLGLRTSEGVTIEHMQKWKSDVDSLLEQKLALMENGRLKLTSEGLLKADSIAEIFV